jgi:hypothetical protein
MIHGRSFRLWARYSFAQTGNPLASLSGREDP